MADTAMTTSNTIARYKLYALLGGVPNGCNEGRWARKGWSWAATEIWGGGTTNLPAEEDKKRRDPQQRRKAGEKGQDELDPQRQFLRRRDDVPTVLCQTCCDGLFVDTAHHVRREELGQFFGAHRVEVLQLERELVLLLICD